MLTTGSKLPEFSLTTQRNKTLTSADLQGQWTILYVYPKDDTPGCTIQGKSFTEKKQAFAEAEVKVYGLSADTVESHEAFCNKYKLDVDLLADPKSTLLSALGVGQSEFKGQKYWNRTTFVIDPEGTIKKTYENVTPQGHEDMLLRDLAKLKGDS